MQMLIYTDTLRTRSAFGADVGIHTNISTFIICRW